MYQLVYKSIEADPFSEADLKHLLLNSRLRNAEVDITGMLIYDRGAFLQMLEGDLGAVISTFARIERDPRHKDISVLLRDPKAGRAYGNWSMGFASGSGAAAVLKGFVDLPDGLRTPALDRTNAVKILDAAAKLAA
jgi:FAD-dependent sensor of blue light